MMTTEEGVAHNVLAPGLGGQVQCSSRDDRKQVSMTQTLSSLPIMSMDYETDETLMQCLCRNIKARQFLQYTANFWSVDLIQRTNNDDFHKAYYVFALVTLVAVFLAMIGSIVLNSIVYQLGPLLVAVTVALDILSVLPAQYLNQQRMLHKAYLHDSIVIDESLRIATFFGYFCTVTIIISVVILLVGVSESSYFYSNIVTLAYAQIIISLYLAFNLLFLMMDLKVSSLLLDQLFLLADRQVLTVEKFNMVRNDIHRRVKNAQFASDFIIGPCMASVLTILVLCFHLPTENKEFVFISFAWVVALTKELAFIFVAFWYVAKVNGRADQLTKQLSSTVWVPAIQSSEYSTSSYKPQLVAGDDAALLQQCLQRCDNMHTDMQRMAICVSCFTDPISFTLLLRE